MAAKKGRRPAPKPPELRKEAIRTWNAFTRLHAGRPSGGMGPGPLPWTEIAAFQQVTGRRLASWELDAIQALDSAYLSSRAGDPPPSSQEPTP